MQKTSDLHVLPLHGAGKEADRFYARPDPLTHLKRKGFSCRFFNLYLYNPNSTTLMSHFFTLPFPLSSDKVIS